MTPPRLWAAPGPAGPRDAEASDDFEQQWSRLLAKSDNFYRQYQSPAWWHHLKDSGLASAANIVSVLDDRGALAGVAPFRVGPQPLVFAIGGRTLGHFELQSVMPLGGVPVARPDIGVHDRIYQELIAQNPDADCLYLHSVRTDGFAWGHLQTSEAVRRQFDVYLPRSVAPFHYLTLPGTFDEYLNRQFRAKKRYNLNRQLRLLAAGLGEPRCERVDTEEQVPMLLCAASLVTSRAWQRSLTGYGLYEVLNSPERLRDLARRGLLRAYVLVCGNRPRAVVLGYQFDGIYHYAEIAHDESAAQFSPGSALLYLLIKDLIDYNPPRHVNFGIGDVEYKRVFGNSTVQDASVMLFRKTPANRMRRLMHSTFRRASRLAKEQRDRWRSTKHPKP